MLPLLRRGAALRSRGAALRGGAALRLRAWPRPRAPAVAAAAAGRARTPAQRFLCAGPPKQPSPPAQPPRQPGGAPAGEEATWAEAVTPDAMRARLTDVEEFVKAHLPEHVARAARANRQRFLLGLGAAVSLVAGFVFMFGHSVKRYFSEQTAEVATQSLKDDALQAQTQELAAAVVQTVLNDPLVLSRAASFLRSAAGEEQTVVALRALLARVLSHPDTLAEATAFAKRVVAGLAADPECQREFATLAVAALQDPETKRVSAALLAELFSDPDMVEVMARLATLVFSDPEVKRAMGETMAVASHSVMEDGDVLDHAKTFMTDVVNDDTVQRTGRDALWSALTPRWWFW